MIYDFCKFFNKWIISNDQPFITTKNKHFQNMIKVLNSDAMISKADTIKNIPAPHPDSIIRSTDTLAKNDVHL